MKQVNGDMEDLFRRAAEKYPLRTDSADWDSLAAALDKDPGPPSDADKDDKRRRRGIFWWWLLLPLVVGAGIYSWHAAGRPSAHLSKAGTQASETQAAGRQGASTQGADVQAGAQGARTLPGGASAGGVPPLESAAQGSGISAKPGGTAAGNKAGSTARGEARSTAGSKAGSTAGSEVSSTSGGEAGSAGGTGLTGLSAGRTRLTRSAAGGSVSTAEAGGISGGNDAGSAAEADGLGGGSTGKNGGYENSAAAEALPSRLDLHRVPTAGSYSVVVDVKAPAARKDSNAKQTKNTTAKSNAGHGYIGLTGAPDLSTVKMQATKGVGTTWGLLLGYAFNSHWAVESGVYLDRKKYYTAGEYFNRADAPSYGSLKSVNGICNMWEVPLNVRYNFNPGSKITWFATAGFSSYFMTKQKYSYEMESSGNSWNQSWSTSVPANYLFSIINLSGGFEQRIGRIGNLRIEPYVRIPLSGIGTGRLPIMSAGLNIGITRQLW